MYYKLVFVIFLVDIAVATWSLNYLISYASQEKIASIAFSIIFSTALYCANNSMQVIVKKFER
jgi:hypothetical protein